MRILESSRTTRDSIVIKLVSPLLELLYTTTLSRLGADAAPPNMPSVLLLLSFWHALRRLHIAIRDAAASLDIISLRC